MISGYRKVDYKKQTDKTFQKEDKKRKNEEEKLEKKEKKRAKKLAKVVCLAPVAPLPGLPCGTHGSDQALPMVLPTPWTPPISLLFLILLMFV